MPLAQKMYVASNHLRILNEQKKLGRSMRSFFNDMIRRGIILLESKDQILSADDIAYAKQLEYQNDAKIDVELTNLCFIERMKNLIRNENRHRVGKRTYLYHISAHLFEVGYHQYVHEVYLHMNFARKLHGQDLDD
jgi:hypothetical protein